jgi:hypothetical protein
MYERAGLNPKTASAFWRLGVLSAADVAELSMEWLEQGFDHPSLAVFAGDRNILLRDTAGDFEKMLITLSDDELSSTRAATKVVLEYYLEKLSSSEIDAFEGMSEIIHIVYYGQGEPIFKFDRYVASEFGIARLYGLYYTLDDYPDADETFRKDVAKEIEAEAEAALNRLRAIEIE